MNECSLPLGWKIFSLVGAKIQAREIISRMKHGKREKFVLVVLRARRKEKRERGLLPTLIPILIRDQFS
jgi:hypothetical protein